MRGLIFGQSFPDMDCIEVNVEGVSQLLTNLDPQKTGGPDNIPTRFLKEFSTQLAPCLTIIFQASLEQGIVPIEWRKAFVVYLSIRKVIAPLRQTIDLSLLPVLFAKL